MKYNKYFIVLLVSLIYFWTMPVLAKESYETTFAKENKIDSLFGRIIENFYISEDWDVEKVKIRILYSNSPIINKDLSNITFSVNNHYFNTLKVEDSDELIKTLDLNVPIEYLKKGINDLEIKTYMRINEEAPCVDDVTVGNWFTTDKNSSIAITYNVNNTYNTISEFYKRFIDKDTLKKQENIIAISNQDDSEGIQAAIIGLIGIAGERLDKESLIRIQPINNFDELIEKNIIYIGVYNGLNEMTKNMISEDVANQLEDKVWFKLVSDNNKNILVITSKNEALLKQMVKILGNKELMLQYNQKEKLVGYDNILNIPMIPKKEIKELTNAGEYLKGPFRQQKEFYINYPKSRFIAEGSTLYLSYRYSDNLDFDRSLVSVYINDQPIGSRGLTKEKANKDSLTLAIPSNLNISGNFNIKVAFDLEQKDLWCTLRNTETPWAYISNESEIQINSKEQPFILFESYPYPFVKDNHIDDMIIVIPDKPDESIYRAISNVFNMLGNFTVINNSDITVKRSSELDEAEKNKNIIAIGTFNENALIRELNPNLFFKFNSTGDTILGNEKIIIDRDYGGNIGTLQLLRSPYNVEKGIMVITSPNSKSIVEASNGVSKETEIWKLYGDGTIIDLDGNIKNYRFKKENIKEAPLIEQIISRKDIRIFILISVLITLMIITIIIYMSRKYSRKS